MKIIRSLFIGVVVAMGGMFFSDILGNIFNGLEYGHAAVLGMCMYLCVVIVTCTGIILSKMDVHGSSGEQTDR